MKREICAAAFLIVIFLACTANINELDALTDSLVELIDAGAESAADGSWDAAEKSVADAIELWDARRMYTSVVLSASDIDTVTQCLYDLHSDAADRQLEEFSDTARLALARIEAIRAQEHPSFGSVF